jgi:hypothetical protein
MDEIRKLLDTKVVLSLWPETGQIFDLSRGATYAAAKRGGEIEVIPFGRLKKVSAAWVKAKLGLDEPAA